MTDFTPAPPMPRDLPPGDSLVSLSRSERMVVDALRRARRGTPFRPCAFVVMVEADGVVLRACGQPERVRDRVGTGY